LGIELSDGVGKGSKVYDVITGMRTFPSVEKPPVATGGSSEVADDTGSEVKEYPRDDEEPRDVDEGPVDSEGDTTLLAGGSTVDEDEFELCAPAVPRRVSKEHSVEKEDARNINGEGRWP